jgi:hypothetical protein
MAEVRTDFLEFPTSPFLAHKQTSYFYLWMAKKFHVRLGLLALQVCIAQAMF